MSVYDVVLKKIEPVLVAGVRDIIPAYPEQGHLWDKLESYLAQQGVQPKGACFTVYHADEPEIDAEVCEPLGGRVAESGVVRVHELPAVEKMASTIHHGSFATIGEAYGALIQWIEGSGYRIVGPCREIYLSPPAQGGNQNDPDTLTEIQFPVEKV